MGRLVAQGALVQEVPDEAEREDCCREEVACALGITTEGTG